MKPLVRWTIGDVKPAGHKSLELSIKKFTQLYDVDVVVCHNCDVASLDYLPQEILYDQRQDWKIKPVGVSWKLYPPRLDSTRHEMVIDNDIIIEERIEEIDRFFNSDSTLLLEDVTRTYGQFENYVPPEYCINSGIYGMPPEFNLQKYIDFYIKKWEINALGEHSESKTFDEQGLIAISLLNYPSFAIIPETSVTICEREFKKSKGMHFIGLNRRRHHRPFQLYQTRRSKLYL